MCPADEKRDLTAKAPSSRFTFLCAPSGRSCVLLTTWTEKQDFHYIENLQGFFFFFTPELYFWGMIIQKEHQCFWTGGTHRFQHAPLLPWVCTSLMWSWPDAPAWPPLPRHKAALPCRRVLNSHQPTCTGPTKLLHLGSQNDLSSPKTWKLSLSLLAEEGRGHGHARLLFPRLVPSLSLLVSARPFGQQPEKSQFAAGSPCARYFMPPEGCPHLDIWGKISDVGRGKEPRVQVMPRTRLLQMSTGARFHPSLPQAWAGNLPPPLLLHRPPPPPQCAGHLQNERSALPSLGSRSSQGIADTSGTVQACAGQSWTVPEPFDRPSPSSAPAPVPGQALLIPPQFPLTLLGGAGTRTGVCVSPNSRKKDRWSEDSTTAHP